MCALRGHLDFNPWMFNCSWMSGMKFNCLNYILPDNQAALAQQPIQPLFILSYVNDTMQSNEMQLDGKYKIKSF